jgi:hypothetical protein
MTRKQIAKIIHYDAAHEVGLVRCIEGTYHIVEGPITTDGPYRWIREDSNYSSAKIKFEAELRRPL